MVSDHPVSAGDRDTLAAVIAEEIMKMPYAHRDTVDPLAAHVADVLLASDWLREQRAEAWAKGADAAIDFSHELEAWIHGQSVTKPTPPPNPYRTTEDTDAH